MWKFHVLRRAVLDEKCGQQKTIRLRPLMKLDPRTCHYRDLTRIIDDEGRRISS